MLTATALILFFGPRGAANVVGLLRPSCATSDQNDRVTPGFQAFPEPGFSRPAVVDRTSATAPHSSRRNVSPGSEMSKPLIAVLSRNERLITDLPVLRGHRFRFCECDSLAETRDFVARNTVAALIADLNPMLEGGHAEDRLLGELCDRSPHLRVILITAENCPEPIERRAVCTGFKHLRGAVSGERLANVLDELFPEAVAEPAPELSLPTPFDEPEPEPETVLAGMTRQFETNTPRMKRMLADLEVAARHNVTILLIGETGAGKTFLARLIHEVSPRRNDPFLNVACGALTAELIESELFGHVKGAFTSAHADKDGKFFAAGRGTVLLDEIDVLSPEQQVKLLRVIETGEFEAVGSNKTMKSQARLVVASNLDLQPLVEQGQFRPDLYYRLNMLKFDVLPLRERKPDIIPLARKFITQLAQKHGVEIRQIERDLYEALLAYPWPGNVRELENVVQRAVIYCRDGHLSARNLPPEIVSGIAGPTNDPSVRLGGTDPRTLNRQIAFTEREIIEQALFSNNQSRTNTARALGISRVTLYNKMKKYGMLSETSSE